jgi:hypothetical protein
MIYFAKLGIDYNSYNPEPIYKILSGTLKRHRKGFEKRDLIENNAYYVSRMKIAEFLSDKLSKFEIEDDYFSKDITVEVDFEIKNNKIKINYINGTEEEFEKQLNNANNKREKAKNILFNILKRDLETWWD